MSDLLIGTGAELRLPSRAFDETDEPPAADEKANQVFVEVEVFADLAHRHANDAAGG